MTGLRVALVAGESSGDQLAAGLIEALRARRPACVFSGVGGPRMAAAGCEILFDMERIGVIGLDGLAAKLPGILSIRRRLFARFAGAGAGAAAADRPDVFVGVDAPDFNLALEGKLRRAGIACAHYVSPTVWAWRAYRLRKIRRSVDHMLTLFPFEAAFYRARGVPVTCVGHPLADRIDAPQRAAARRALGLGGGDGGDGLYIALLPGSRRSEITRLARVFMDAARRIVARHRHARFILPFANAAAAESFAAAAGPVHDLPLRTLPADFRPVNSDAGARGRTPSQLALEACDVGIVASGTAALEAALLRRAHLVAYKLAAPSYHLMRRLRRVDYYSMPNQLLPRPLVPELIQGRATAANIAAEALALLDDPARVAALERHFAAMHQSLKLGANERAADAVLRLAEAA
ncbi:MAG: lipid-A-disaccharide synthase [Gammaproteobacteria bacterium]|nr:lipid-A-disaccharide synthase [Gammaproteobacteria bacterium]